MTANFNKIQKQTIFEILRIYPFWISDSNIDHQNHPFWETPVCDTGDTTSPRNDHVNVNAGAKQGRLDEPKKRDELR